MERTIKTKKELKERIKEIKETIKSMEVYINHENLDGLTCNDFADLMCLSSELYFAMGGE